MNNKECPHNIDHKDTHRQSNALRVETMPLASRCLLKMPEHWSSGAKEVGALRWIGSGGSCLVFGLCDSNCPLKNEGGVEDHVSD